MEGKKPRFPPSLNAVKSEYKIFCDSYGGPIICDDRFAKVNFEYCCREFPRRMFQPATDRWATEPVHGIRHWPLMALRQANTHFDSETLRSTEPKHRPHSFGNCLMRFERVHGAFPKHLLRFRGCRLA
jgi:hypothetical protein